jgi:SulP family sulfate permease
LNRLRRIIPARIIPAFDWLADYDKTCLRGDLAGGLTVGVIAVPQAMAYAMMAGVPPIYGLYASLIPLLVYAFLGTSRQLAVGPVAISFLIISAGLAPLAEPFSPRYVEMAILTALMVGCIQIFMGVFRLGFIVNFLSRPVIVGFMTAAPLIIAGSQLGNLLGLDLPHTQHLSTLILAVFEQFRAIDPLTLGLGLAAMAIMLGIRFFKPSAPAALVVVLLGTLAVYLFDLDALGVAVVGEVPAGLPGFSLPEVDLNTLRDLAPTAVTVALEQCMVVMSLGAVFAARHGHKVRPNRELIAIGASNGLGSFFGGLPVSGSFSRSAVNDGAGAKTPLANVVAAGVVGLTLLFLTPLFYYLPIAVLAAVIMVVALNLIDLPQLRHLLKTKRRDGIIAFLTFGCTLSIGIQEGILIGVAASIFAILYRISRPQIHELGRVPGTHEFRSVAHFPDARLIPGIHMLRIDASLSFANAELLREKLLQSTTADGREFDALIIDATAVNDLDTTSAAMLAGVIDTLHARQVDLYIAGAKGHVRQTLRRSGLAAELGEEHFPLTVDLAVQRVEELRDGSTHAEDGVKGVR